MDPKTGVVRVLQTMPRLEWSLTSYKLFWEKRVCVGEGAGMVETGDGMVGLELIFHYFYD